MALRENIKISNSVVATQLLVQNSISVLCLSNINTKFKVLPVMALEWCVMMPELMKNPNPILSAVSTVTVLSLTLNGF